MNPFLAYSIVSFVAAVVWTILLLRANRSTIRGISRRVGCDPSFGLILAGRGRPLAVEFSPACTAFWLIAIILLAIAAATTWSAKQPLRFLIVSCALISIVVNVAAGLHFLWIATVSPGGV